VVTINRFLKNIITAAVITAAAVTCVYGALTDNHIKDSAVLLPKASKVKFNWVMPPSDEKAEASGLIFKMDSKGGPWFSRDGKYFLAPYKDYIFGVNGHFDDFVLTDKGNLLIASRGYLGFIPRVKNLKTAKSSFAFQPFTKLPAGNCRLFPADGGIVYIAGTDIAAGGDEVFTLGGEGSLKTVEGKGKALVYKKIFSTEKRITALAGDGKTTFIALDRLVVSVKPDSDKIDGVFIHPSETITGLAYDSKAGLFYCTDKGVGYAGKDGNCEFLMVPSPEIAVSAGKLYVYLKDKNGLLEIDGIQDFKSYFKKTGDKK
jgi:hypothetical protein